ncbi:MAG: hypothetical protein WA667_09270 [Candidatus Nitrosopolaris sp.]
MFKPIFAIIDTRSSFILTCYTTIINKNYSEHVTARYYHDDTMKQIICTTVIGALLLFGFFAMQTQIAQTTTGQNGGAGGDGKGGIGGAGGNGTNGQTHNGHNGKNASGNGNNGGDGSDGDGD